MGSDRPACWWSAWMNHFNPRSPDGERPARRSWAVSVRAYFNPRSPDGERLRYRCGMVKRFLFQSTLPGWGATPREINFRARNYFNPRSPDGERLDSKLVFGLTEISIHAPRMGSDPFSLGTFLTSILFQSTLPGWGATRAIVPLRLQQGEFQSTLPGWGATLGAVHAHGGDLVISIHAPRMGSDRHEQN